MKWPQPILRHHVTTLRTDRHDSSLQTATVTPTTCSKGRQLQPGMKEAVSRWQSNPLAAYILCCTPPRDVQAPYEQRGGFPFIYSTKIDITIQVHPLETPTCNPFQHPCSKRGNRNKVVTQPRKVGWPLQRVQNCTQEEKLRAKPATDVMADVFHGFPQIIIHRPLHTQIKTPRSFTLSLGSLNHPYQTHQLLRTFHVFFWFQNTTVRTCTFAATPVLPVHVPCCSVTHSSTVTLQSTVIGTAVQQSLHKPREASDD